MATSYNKFLQLPLFQGIDKKTLTNIIEKVKFNFKTFDADTHIIKKGMSCKALIFILEGDVIKETISQDNTFTIEESIAVNSILEPTSLFGLNPVYHSSYICQTETKILSIDKNFIITYLMNDNIFKLNFVNILSSKVHQQYKSLWYNTNNHKLIEEFKKFVIQHCEILEGKTVIKISMTDLAIQLRETRLNVSKMLNTLKKKDIIEMKRLIITIPNLPALLESDI